MCAAEQNALLSSFIYRACMLSLSLTHLTVTGPGPLEWARVCAWRISLINWGDAKTDRTADLTPHPFPLLDLLLSPQEAADSHSLSQSINYLIVMCLIMQSAVNYAFVTDMPIITLSKPSEWDSLAALGIKPGAWLRPFLSCIRKECHDHLVTLCF